jgi:hypothetical protein
MKDAPALRYSSATVGSKALTPHVLAGRHDVGEGAADRGDHHRRST